MQCVLNVFLLNLLGVMFVSARNCENLLTSDKVITKNKKSDVFVGHSVVIYIMESNDR